MAGPQVTAGAVHAEFVIERLDDLHEIRFACQLSGMYADWRLTDAQGATFVDVEMGMQPKGAGDKVFDAVSGRLYFRPLARPVDRRAAPQVSWRDVAELDRAA